MRQRVFVALLVLTLGALLLAGLRFLPGRPLAAFAGPEWLKPLPTGTVPASTPARATPTLSPLAVRPAEVSIDTKGWIAWAMLDRRTGEVVGSANMAATGTTASLVKAWIGADFLRRASTGGRKPTRPELDRLTILIRDSDNDAAQTLWAQLGYEASTNRMIKICGLTDSKAHNNWSLTRLSPRDVARLGDCIADGRAAGPAWTKWLLGEMRQVRGVGDFGIRKAFPSKVAKTIAIKNGWVIRDERREWDVNCLAIGDGWTMGVMTRFPTNLDYTYGAGLCEEVARQLRAR